MGLEWKAGEPNESGDLWVVAQIDAEWKVACRVEVQGDALVIAELRLGSRPDAVPVGGIGTAQVQAIGIRGALAVARAAGMRPGLFREAADPEAAFKYARSRRRRDRAPKLAAIALAYEQAWSDGRQDVAVALVEATGQKYATVVSWIHAARVHEPPLLTGGGYGAAGGTATDEARRIAEEWWFAFAQPASATATAYSATVKTEDDTGSRTHSRTH